MKDKETSGKALKFVCAATLATCIGMAYAADSRPLAGVPADDPGFAVPGTGCEEVDAGNGMKAPVFRSGGILTVTGGGYVELWSANPCRGTTSTS